MKDPRPPLLERRGVAGAVVALAASAVYATSLAVPFLNWDDGLYVTFNPRVQAHGFLALARLWSSNDAYDAKFLEFFPLRDTVYWLLWQAFGKNPLPFHLTNIAFHTATSVLVVQLARKFGLTARAAFWGGLLFAVHPVHSESVVWISGLKDPFFTLLLVAAVLSWLRYREHGRPLDHVLTLLFMIASLTVKSIAMCLPLLLLAIEWLLPPRPRLGALVARLAAPTAIAAIFLTEFVLVGRASNNLTGPHGGTWANHFVLMAWAAVRYLQQAFVPVVFKLHYCFEPPAWPFDVRMLGIVAATVAVAAYFLWARRHQPVLALLGAWFFACLLPVANLVPFPAIMADRYLYAPSIGTCLIAAWVVCRLDPRLGRWLLPALGVALGLVTLSRGLVWQHERDLWAEVALDDACLNDDLTTASVVYLKNASLETDPGVALEFWKKGLGHAQFKTLFKEDQCNYLAAATRIALQTGKVSLARQWSEQGTTTCPWLASAWTNRMMVVGSSDPQAGLEAARRAARLAPFPGTRWQFGHARLANGDLEGAEDLAYAVDASPERFCGLLLDWLPKAAPATQTRLEPQRQRCASMPPVR